MSGVCGSGYYRDVLSVEATSPNVTGDLVFGSNICLPCNRLCSQCTGAGTDKDVCTECAFARTQDLLCVDGCNALTGKGWVNLRAGNGQRLKVAFLSSLPCQTYAFTILNILCV